MSKSQDKDKPQTLPKSDDLMSLNLSDVVKEAKEASVDYDTTLETPLDTPSTETSIEETQIPHSWENFLAYHKEYSIRKSHHRRNIYIELDIIDLFKNCDIDSGRTSNLINAALRSFIEDHKPLFKASLRPRPTLIQLD